MAYPHRVEGWFLCSLCTPRRTGSPPPHVARSPGAGAGAEVFKTTLFLDTDRSGVPFGAGYPGDKGIVLSVGRLGDPLYITVAPIENRPANSDV